MKDDLIAYFALALSVAAHVPLALGEGSSRTPVSSPQPAFVELVSSPPPEEPKEVPTQELEPPKPPPVESKPPPKTPKAKPSEPPEEPVAAEPPPASEVVPAELTGTTLVSDVGAAWSAPIGNGAERDGAIGVAAPKKPVSRSASPVRPEPARSVTVPLAELSRKPLPPSLRRVLERHYPPNARRLGQSGEAKVRARIEANGEVRVANVTTESGHGFGAACRAALLESRWSPPLNRHGEPVATWVGYRCKFRVDD